MWWKMYRHNEHDKMISPKLISGIQHCLGTRLKYTQKPQNKLYASDFYLGGNVWSEWKPTNINVS